MLAFACVCILVALLSFYLMFLEPIVHPGYRDMAHLAVFLICGPCLICCGFYGIGFFLCPEFLTVSPVGSNLLFGSALFTATLGLLVPAILYTEALRESMNDILLFAPLVALPFWAMGFLVSLVSYF